MASRMHVCAAFVVAYIFGLTTAWVSYQGVPPPICPPCALCGDEGAAAKEVQDLVVEKPSDEILESAKKEENHSCKRSTDEAAFSKALKTAEKRFSGGIVRGVRCANGKTCMGSDRMSGKKHNYSTCYAQFLNKWRKMAERTPEAFVPVLVAEVGILMGSGLAIWSEMFGCDAQIHGFDMYLENTKAKMPFMKKQGAFAKENLQLHTIDQMKNNTAIVGAIAEDKKFSFVVDDGYHTMESIHLTFESFKPFLHETFLYVVEDIDLDDLDTLKKSFKNKNYHIDSCDADERILAITRY